MTPFVIMVFIGASYGVGLLALLGTIAAVPDDDDVLSRRNYLSGFTGMICVASLLVTTYNAARLLEVMLIYSNR